MQDKRSRRRLLADMLFVGGALVGASVLGRPEPFFEHLLEAQTPPAPPRPELPLAVTRAYPSDSDTDLPRVTCSTSDFDDSRGCRRLTAE